jgi:hypothetical protein|tara:strand:+ start:1402 stop:1632 length:231 start_codon:yes stop_codon:yes gene_type:complete
MQENQRPDLGEDNTEYEDDEYLMKCVVDTVKKSFYLYSSDGDTKNIVCETSEQFMNVLELVRATCPEDRLSYTNPY